MQRRRVDRVALLLELREVLHEKHAGVVGRDDFADKVGGHGRAGVARHRLRSDLVDHLQEIRRLAD